MSNHQIGFWKKHVDQLKSWDKSIAEYARFHKLRANKIYYWKRILNKRTGMIVTGDDPKFVPVHISESRDQISLKIKKSGLDFELSGLSIQAVRELLFEVVV